jgi:hypothetical protein
MTKLSELELTCIKCGTSIKIECPQKEIDEFRLYGGYLTENTRLCNEIRAYGWATVPDVKCYDCWLTDEEEYENS